MFRTILLLTASNIFMTFAWYGNLKNTEMPIWKAILISWGIAFFEYCLMVPANRLGYTTGMNGFQLKITQEVITLVVFTFFALFYLKEPFHWKYIVSLYFSRVLCILCSKNKWVQIRCYHIAVRSVHISFNYNCVIRHKNSL